FFELDGLFDGDQAADAHFSEPLDRLNDDFDVLALLVNRHENRQIAQFGQHAAQFRLKDDEHRQDEVSGEGGQQILQDAQLQDEGHKDKREQQDQETGNHWRAVSPSNEAKSVVDADCENQYLQQRPPVQYAFPGPGHAFLWATIASVMRIACTVCATSCARMTFTPASMATL